MNKTKEELIREIKMYLTHITKAHNYYISYKTLVDAVNSDAFNAKINLAPAFFSITLNALFDSIQLELSKLYCDKSNEEMTLGKLINMAEANSKLFPVEIECGTAVDDDEQIVVDTKIKKIDINKELKKAKEDLAKMDSIVINLNTRRDKMIAHNDKKYFLSSKTIYRDFPLTMSDFYTLIYFAGDFCNTLLCYLNGSVVGYNMLDAEDLKDLLIKTSI